MTSSLATILKSVIVTKSRFLHKNQMTFALTFDLIFTKANYGVGKCPLSFRDIWLRSSLSKKESGCCLELHTIRWNLERDSFEFWPSNINFLKTNQVEHRGNISQSLKSVLWLTKQNQSSGGLLVRGHRDTQSGSFSIKPLVFHHYTLCYCISKKRPAGKCALLKLERLLG